MGARVLVAYATRYGSTAEVAQTIAEILSEEGAEVDVRRVGNAIETSRYDAVVVGSPARLGRLLPESIAFVRRNAAELWRLNVAYFITGLTMRVDTASNRRQAESYLQPLCRIRPPVRTGLFGGKVDRSKLGPLLRLFLSRDRSGTLSEGDYRDWTAIKLWARELAPVLTGEIG